MADEKAVVLNSRDAFESEHMPRSFKSWLKLYGSIGMLICVPLSMLGDHGEFASVMIVLLFLLAIVFGVMIFVSRMRNRGSVEKAVEEIRSKKFKLGDTLTVDDIYNKVQADSSRVYFALVTVEREGDKIFATYDDVRYEIILNGDGTFSVAGKNSSDLDKKFYDKIREGTPIIAFGLQQVFGVK